MNKVTSSYQLFVDKVTCKYQSSNPILFLKASTGSYAEKNIIGLEVGMSVANSTVVQVEVATQQQHHTSLFCNISKACFVQQTVDSLKLNADVIRKQVWFCCSDKDRVSDFLVAFNDSIQQFHHQQPGALETCKTCPSKVVQKPVDKPVLRQDLLHSQPTLFSISQKAIQFIHNFNQNQDILLVAENGACGYTVSYSLICSNNSHLLADCEKFVVDGISFYVQVYDLMVIAGTQIDLQRRQMDVFLSFNKPSASYCCCGSSFK